MSHDRPAELALFVPPAPRSRRSSLELALFRIFRLPGPRPRPRRPNWVCLYKTLGIGPQMPQLAQVWLCLFTATPLLAAGHPKLGLFVQDPRHRPPDAPTRPSLALLVHSDTPPRGWAPQIGFVCTTPPCPAGHAAPSPGGTPPRCPASGNWLRFAQSASGSQELGSFRRFDQPNWVCFARFSLPRPWPTGEIGFVRRNWYRAGMVE
jgi:hypothetical protein